MTHLKSKTVKSVQTLNKNILKQIDDEGIFIPISHGSMTVVAPKDLEKVSFTQSQYELPFNEMQYK